MVSNPRRKREKKKRRPDSRSKHGGRRRAIGVIARHPGPGPAHESGRKKREPGVVSTLPSPHPRKEGRSQTVPQPRPAVVPGMFRPSGGGKRKGKILHAATRLHRGRGKSSPVTCRNFLDPGKKKKGKKRACGGRPLGSMGKKD